MRILRPQGLTHPSSRASRDRRALVVAAVTAIVLVGCGRGGDDVVEPELEPGQPIDVTGRAGLVFHDLSTSGTRVFPGGSTGDLPVITADETLQAAADAVRDWLDTVLSERNRGLTTMVALSEVDAAEVGRVLGADGPATDGVLDTQVSRAIYRIEIAHLGAPGWALARVESELVSSDDPATVIGRRFDSFVFTFDVDGRVEFVALEVGP